jgi:hypothetical protein
VLEGLGRGTGKTSVGYSRKHANRERRPDA